MLDSKGPMIENKTKTNATIAKFEIVSQIGVTEIEDSTLNQFLIAASKTPVWKKGFYLR